SQPLSRLRVDDAPGLQTADDGLDEPGDEPRVRFSKHSPAVAAKSRRDVAALEPWYTQELKHRSGSLPQHIPWNDRLSTVDNTGHLIRWAPAGPGRPILETGQAEESPDVARPVDIELVRARRRKSAPKVL